MIIDTHYHRTIYQTWWHNLIPSKPTSTTIFSAPKSSPSFSLVNVCVQHILLTTECHSTPSPTHSLDGHTLASNLIRLSNTISGKSWRRQVAGRERESVDRRTTPKCGQGGGGSINNFLSLSILCLDTLEACFHRRWPSTIRAHQEYTNTHWPRRRGNEQRRRREGRRAERLARERSQTRALSTHTIR